MASFDDLQMEWSMLCQDCTDWTATDLQLAAELGKTLLERNKELENNLKQHQNVIDDQTQEIEYLTKQTVALREVNDSRLRIYEQLEVSIQDLERANHRLAVDNSADKKHIKNLTANIEALELKCEELQGTIDDLTLQLDTLKRRTLKRPSPSVNSPLVNNFRRLDYQENEEIDYSPTPTPTPTQKEEPSRRKSGGSSPTHQEKVSGSPKQDEKDNLDSDTVNEQLTQLLTQLRESRTLFSREQRRTSELEEQLATILQQNQLLEKQLLQLHFKDEEAKSMHEELITLEEVRQGQLCGRCLRTIDSPRTGDDLSCLGDEPEDDDTSMLEALLNHSQHRSSFSMDIQDCGKTPPIQRQEPNLYRDLVEKYEALLEVQRTQTSRTHQKPIVNNSLSLQEEMQMSGNFNHLTTKDTDEESGHGDSLQPEKASTKARKSLTPTDFSEAETSSSGFSDETSNKATQTEGRPGSFLCTIADGEDCKFSIYDDATAVDSRFRNRPEYRELFSEIFTVLKKAAENKDDGEELPLLDDHTPVRPPKVPPVTPANDGFPDFPDNLTDDTQSVLSSTMSEISTTPRETLLLENNDDAPRTPPATNAHAPAPSKTEPVLTPYVRQPLEYLTVGVNVRKRSASRRKKQLVERSNSPATPILGSPKVTYSSRTSSGRKRKETQPAAVEAPSIWNGNTLHFFSRKSASPTPSLNENAARNAQYENALEYKPSMASQDLFKLKRLDLSYAEVLRNADSKKRETSTLRHRRKF